MYSLLEILTTVSAVTAAVVSVLHYRSHLVSLKPACGLESYFQDGDSLKIQCFIRNTTQHAVHVQRATVDFGELASGPSETSPRLHRSKELLVRLQPGMERPVLLNLSHEGEAPAIGAALCRLPGSTRLELRIRKARTGLTPIPLRNVGTTSPSADGAAPK